MGANRSAVIQFMVTNSIQQMQIDGRLPKSIDAGQTLGDLIAKK
jgi:hypothetical protein